MPALDTGIISEAEVALAQGHVESSDNMDQMDWTGDNINHALFKQ